MTCGTYREYKMTGIAHQFGLFDRRQNPTSKDYDYRLIYECLQGLVEAKEEGDTVKLVNLLRSGDSLYLIST